jgi:hypothetical protein
VAIGPVGSHPLDPVAHRQSMPGHELPRHQNADRGWPLLVCLAGPAAASQLPRAGTDFSCTAASGCRSDGVLCSRGRRWLNTKPRGAWLASGIKTGDGSPGTAGRQRQRRHCAACNKNPRNACHGHLPVGRARPARVESRQFEPYSSEPASRPVKLFGRGSCASHCVGFSRRTLYFGSTKLPAREAKRAVTAVRSAIARGP